MKRVQEYILNFLFNGALFTFIIVVFKFIFLVLTPANLYFDYQSVEPLIVPAYIEDGYIQMKSTLQVNVSGDLRWNDVLRCLSEDGNFNYVGQYDTNADTVNKSDGYYTSIWKYQGEMPTSPSLCRIDSTITRTLDYGVEKRQYIQSQPFMVE